MNRTVFRAGMAIFATVAAASCAELSLPPTLVAPATSLLLPVSFTSQSSSVTAIQFDLQYDSTALNLCVTAGESARTSGKTLYLWDLAPGQRRFLIVGHNSDTILDGVLSNPFVSLSSTAPGGIYPLTLPNVVATGSSANAVTLKYRQRRHCRSLGCGLRLATPNRWPTERCKPASRASSGGRGSNRLRGRPRSDFTPATQDLSHIWRQDYSVNSPSNPAQKGSVIVLFIWGASQTDTSGVNGQIAGDPIPKPLPIVSAQIGGLAAQVLYTSATPELDGVLQVKCTVPLESPSGSAVPILVNAGKTSSPAGITLAIR